MSPYGRKCEYSLLSVNVALCGKGDVQGIYLNVLNVLETDVQGVGVCATRDPRLFAAVPPWNENPTILNSSFRTAAPAHGAMPTQA